MDRDLWQLERLDDNAMTLDCAYWREGKDEWSSCALPVIAIQKRLNELKYDGPLTLRFKFSVQNMVQSRQLRLVVEHPERYVITLNGNVVTYADLPFWRDIRWLPIEITGQISEGQNVIEMHCEQFQHGDLNVIDDQFGRYGTEIEAIYLVGDFSVIGHEVENKSVSFKLKKNCLPEIELHYFEEDGFYLTEPQDLYMGDTTVQGLVFYSGRIQMKAKLPHFDARNVKEVWFCIDDLDAAVAEVFVDDKKVGSLISRPFRIDITKFTSSCGCEIKIIIYGTLRNLLGPHHHVDGELFAVGPEHFLPEFKGQEYALSVTEWMTGQVEPLNWSNRYCTVSFGKLGSAFIGIIYSDVLEN